MSKRDHSKPFRQYSIGTRRTSHKRSPKVRQEITKNTRTTLHLLLGSSPHVRNEEDTKMSRELTAGHSRPDVTRILELAGCGKPDKTSEEFMPPAFCVPTLCSTNVDFRAARALDVLSFAFRESRSPKAMTVLRMASAATPAPRREHDLCPKCEQASRKKRARRTRALQILSPPLPECWNCLVLASFLRNKSNPQNGFRV